MNKSTMLLRQIHPEWWTDGRPNSKNFTPDTDWEVDGTKTFKLSNYNGDKYLAEESYIHFTKVRHFQSCGVYGVEVDFYENEELICIEDHLDFEGHVSVDFSNHGKNQRINRSKRISEYAHCKGWLFKDEKHSVFETETLK